MTNVPLVERSTCKALIITCSDFRFIGAARQFALQQQLEDDYDLIARPGAIRSLVQPRNEAARTTMEEEIRLLWSLHRFTRILAVNHRSCRAYDDLCTPATERDVHSEHLRRARRVLADAYPGISAEVYLADIEHGRIEIVPVG